MSKDTPDPATATAAHQLMDRRTRIQAALCGIRTDRIPRYEIFLDGFKRSFRKHHGLPEDYDVYDWYDRIDIGTILADQRGPLYSSEHVRSDDGDITISRDSWGRVLLQRRSAYFEQVQAVALEKKSDLDRLIFDDPIAADKFSAITEHAKNASRRFAPVSGILGLFMGSYRMRGEFDYLIDLADDLAFCQELAERLGDFLTQTGLELARCTNTLDTAIWIYDELSSTRGPLFSPDTFARIFYPVYKRMISTWRSFGAKTIILHCDGNCLPLLDMLLDAGFNGLQGIAPSTGMWLPDLKKAYGNRLILIGGMDNIRTLTQGERGQIEMETAALIEAAQEGGVIIGTHSIDEDVTPDRYNCYSSYLDLHDSL